MVIFMDFKYYLYAVKCTIQNPNKEDIKRDIDFFFIDVKHDIGFLMIDIEYVLSRFCDYVEFTFGVLKDFIFCFIL